MSRAFLVAGLAAAALPASAGAQAAPCADQDLALAAASAARGEDAVVCLVNRERTARGLKALGRNGKLDAAAQGHTDDMLAKLYFDHTAPLAALATPGLRATAAGYAWSYVGENIASGQATPREVMAAWMASTGHCHNILSPEFVEIGVGAAPGFATGGNYGATWTQNFGRAQGVASPGGPTAPSATCPYQSLTADTQSSSGSGSESGADAHGNDDNADADADNGKGHNGKSPGQAGKAPAGQDSGSAGLATPVDVRSTVVRRGRRLTVAGVITPATADVPVTITVRIGKRVSTSRARSGRRGTFAAVVRLPRGTGRVVVEIAAAGTVSGARLR
jgi:uncharacterized protein YkwD